MDEELLKLIKRIWKKFPKLRLCQLIGNCFPPGDLYHIENRELKKALKRTYGL